MDPYITTGLLLVIPSLVVLTVALFGKSFYQRKEWERWNMQAGLLGLVVSLVDQKFGRMATRMLIIGFSGSALLLGIWILALR